MKGEKNKEQGVIDKGVEGRDASIDTVSRESTGGLLGTDRLQTYQQSRSAEINRHFYSNLHRPIGSHSLCEIRRYSTTNSERPQTDKQRATFYYVKIALEREWFL
jgi:hypothetical protein